MNCPVRGDGAAVVSAPLTAQPLKLGEGDPAYGSAWCRALHQRERVHLGAGAVPQPATGCQLGHGWL